MPGEEDRKLTEAQRILKETLQLDCTGQTKKDVIAVLKAMLAELEGES